MTTSKLAASYRQEAQRCWAAAQSQITPETKNRWRMLAFEWEELADNIEMRAATIGAEADRTVINNSTPNQ